MTTLMDANLLFVSGEFFNADAGFLGKLKRAPQGINSPFPKPLVDSGVRHAA